MRPIIFLFSLALFFSCNSKEKEARALLEEARSLYDSSEYIGAKLLLDSLKTTYTKEFPVQRERQALVKEIELSEQNRNLLYCDSLLSIKVPEAETLKKEFIFEQDTAYEATGKYLYKTQSVEQNIQRSYLRSTVNEKGEMLLFSVYYGGKALRHAALKVSLRGGEYAQTESIPFDGGNNYTFTDGGMITETVTYAHGKDNGAIAFIANYEGKEAIKLSYLGDREYTTTLSSVNQKAISATYRLAIALSEVEELKKQRTIALAKIDYLKERMKPAAE